MESEAKNCKTTGCWQQKCAKCEAEYQKPRGSVVITSGQEKQHHTGRENSLLLPISSSKTFTGIDVSGQMMLKTLLMPVDKFKPTFLVGCAISEAGVFTPFIGSVKGQAIDADVYITKYLPKVIKFIEKLQKLRDNLLVWSGIVPLRKENVGMVGSEKYKKSAQSWKSFKILRNCIFCSVHFLFFSFSLLFIFCYIKVLICWINYMNFLLERWSFLYLSSSPPKCASSPTHWKLLYFAGSCSLCQNIGSKKWGWNLR
jgi:hypothetical protein